MDKFVNWVAENPYWAFAGLIATFLGLLVSIGALIIQRKRRALFYSISTTVLIENRISKIDGIEVLYHNKKIDSILITTLHLWNGGNTLLTRDSFYPDYGLCLILNEDCEFLGTELVSESSDTCKASTSVNGNKTYVLFDFLEKGQSITLNIYHTYAPEPLIAVSGKMIEGNIINKTVEIQNKIEAIHISTRLFDIRVDNPFYNFCVRFCEIFGVRIKTKRK